MFLMFLDLDRNAFRAWLSVQDPARPCGLRVSRADNPLSRYLRQACRVEEAVIDSIGVRCVGGPRPHGAVFPTPVWALAFLAHLNQPGRPAAVTVAEAEVALTLPLRLTHAQVASPSPPSIPRPRPIIPGFTPPNQRTVERMAAIGQGLDRLLFSPPG